MSGTKHQINDGNLTGNRWEDVCHDISFSEKEDKDVADVVINDKGKGLVLVLGSVETSQACLLFSQLSFNRDLH